MASEIHADHLLTQVLECPVGRVIRSSAFHVSKGVPSKNPMRYEMRVFGAFSLVYLYRGGGYYADVNGFNQTLCPGDAIFIYPEIGHRYWLNEKEGWDEINITFDGPIFELWRKQGLFQDSYPVVRLEPTEYWHRRFRSVGKSPARQSPLETICYLMQLLAEIRSYHHSRSMSETDSAWLTDAKMLLCANVPVEDFKLDDIAQQLGDSYVNFRKKFARMTGSSPAKFHMKTIIERACELIRQEKLTNREVTDRLGFSNEYYFSRRFKQVLGFSPSDFRRYFLREP